MQEFLDPLKNPTLVAAPFFILSLLIELAAFKYLETDEEMRGYERKDARTSISWASARSCRARCSSSAPSCSSSRSASTSRRGTSRPTPGGRGRR